MFTRLGSKGEPYLPLDEALHVAYEPEHEPKKE
jgi:hypothetical protein